VQVVAQDVTWLKWLEGTFSRYVSPAVIEQMQQMQSEDLLRMERRTLSVLFVDMRGFTRLSQNLPPEGVGEMVNSFLASMVSCVEKLDGTIDKYVGDNVMAFFGAPVCHPDHAMRALVCAVEMQQKNREWVAARTAQNMPGGFCGVGIATGPVVVGNIGTKSRMDYTALGHTTNMAARLCGAAAPGEILTIESTYKAASDQKKLYQAGLPLPHMGFAAKGKMQFKNVDERVEVISVTLKG
ncbi:MAG: adenylate/guanylate cyclase domain-containing protein, partial [Myxococcota bacterium]